MEVKKAIAKLYVEQSLRGKIAGQVGAGDIVEVLNLEDPESLFHISNRLFSSIDYVRYPVHDEASLRAFVQVYFAGAGLDPKMENHNAFGRSDLEVRASSRLWVLEFKVCRKGDNEEKILQEALTQMAERHYGEQDKVQTLSVAVVFSLDKTSFTKWASLPLSKDCS